jgi:hypothetical protein
MEAQRPPRPSALRPLAVFAAPGGMVSEGKLVNHATRVAHINRATYRRLACKCGNCRVRTMCREVNVSVADRHVYRIRQRRI